jgi:hypothetical protein
MMGRLKRNQKIGEEVEVEIHGHTRIAPISPQLVLCYIAERVLGLPKSY